MVQTSIFAWSRDGLFVQGPDQHCQKSVFYSTRLPFLPEVAHLLPEPDQPPTIRGHRSRQWLGLDPQQRVIGRDKTVGAQ